MSLPVILIITSQRCSHCVRMRGDGRLNSSFEEDTNSTLPGGYSYNDTFIRKLIVGNPNAIPTRDNMYLPQYRIYNLHVSKMSSLDNQILEIIEFTLKNSGSIEQRIYTKKDLNTDVEIYTINPSGKFTSKLHHTSTPWLDIIKTMIPSGYTNYLYFYPMIVYFNARAWDRSLCEGLPIYGYINGAETLRTPPYGPVPGQINIRVVDPVILAASFINKEKILLDAPSGINTALISKVRDTSNQKFQQIHLPTDNTCSNLGYKILPLTRH